MMITYPLFLRGESRDYIWGGHRLGERFGKMGGRIAESWELCGESVVENGIYAGQKLREVLGADFPLLVKFMDAREKLSVQVHPSDENAIAPERGKEELWYIVEAEPGSTLGCGLKKDVTAQELREAALSGQIEELLHQLPVAAGESIYIAPGTVHALGAGILAAEFQQASDTTFRLYDYGRGRELHLERGCAVADCRAARPEKLLPRGSGDVKEILRTPHFRLRELCSREDIALSADRWQHLLLLEAGGVLVHAGEKYPLYPGASVFLPEGLGEYRIEGACRALIMDN